jgi:PEP-CTERM motif
MKLRMAWLAILCLAPGAIPARAQSYDNGPINGNTDAWTINYGFVVSDTFVAPYPGYSFNFQFGVWEVPYQVGPCALSVCGTSGPMLSVQWSITSGENSGKLFGSGTANGGNLTDQFISNNQYGYDIDLITVTTNGGGLTPGSIYWLNLQNANMLGGAPVYWDENSGKGCKSNGCPSMASENEVGTIPSEAFTIYTGDCSDGRRPSGGCAPGGAPEPSSIMLFGSGILGLVGILRRTLF